jgi:micrococcal nuclease
MNFKKSLKNISFILFLGLCLILIGLVLLSQRTRLNIVPPVPLKSSIPLITPIPPVFTTAKVIRVYDGDTIEIEGGQKVRYIGIDSSEVYPKEQCYAQEARKINSDLVMGKVVQLEKDVSETDKYGRLLRYVYINNEFINDELVKNGSAKVETVPPDVKYKNEFLQSQTYAKEYKLGLWGKCF